MSQTITQTSFPGIGYVLRASAQSGTVRTEPPKPKAIVRLNKKNKIVRVEIESSQIKLSENPQKIVIVIMDFSGSMASYYHYLNQIINTIINDNPDAENVYIICYGTDLPNGFRDPNKFTVANYPRDYYSKKPKRGEDIICSRGTNFNPPMEVARSIIKQSGNCIPEIEFFSDGESTYCYETIAKNLIKDVTQRNGKINAYAFGYGANIKYFHTVQKICVDEISTLIERFSGVYASLEDRNIGTLTVGTTGGLRLPIRLVNNGINIIGSVLVRENITQDTHLRIEYTSNYNTQTVDLTLGEDITEENDVESMIESLISISENPQIFNLTVLREFLTSLTIINRNSQLSSDPRITILNEMADRLIQMIPSSQRSYRSVTSTNVVSAVDFNTIIKRMSRLYSAIQSGKIRRNVKNASRKLAKHAAEIVQVMEQFDKIGFPNPIETTTDTDGIYMPVEGETVMLTSIMASSNSDSIEQVLDAMANSGNVSIELANLVAGINNPASVRIRINPSGFLCLSTVVELARRGNLQTITHNRSVYFPYGNHDFAWLQRAMRQYAGLIVSGHPIRLSANAGMVYWTSLTNMIHNADGDSLHHYQALSTLYGYASAYSMSTVNRDLRRNIFLRYNDNPIAIYLSRAEGSDGQLANIQSTLGSILTMVGPSLGDYESSSFEHFEGLIHSVIIENIRQLFRKKVRTESTIYRTMMSRISDTIGLTMYEDEDRVDNVNLTEFLDKYSGKFREIVERNGSTREIVQIMESFVNINFTNFTPSMENIQEIINDFTPTSTDNGAIGVPDYYSMNDLRRIIGNIRFLSRNRDEWLAISNQTLGIIPEEFSRRILESPEYEIDNEILLRILMNIGYSSGDISKMIANPFMNIKDIIKLMQYSSNQKDINKKRLITLYQNLFKVALPTYNMGLLCALLQIGSEICSWDTISPEIIAVLEKIRDKVKNKTVIHSGRMYILNIIGNLILDDKIANKCIELGIPINMIEKSQERFLCLKGILKPSLKHVSKSIRKVVEILTSSFVSLKITDRTTNNGSPIYELSGSAVRAAVKETPILSTLGGWHLMITFRSMEFVVWKKPQNGEEFYHCIKINEFERGKDGHWDDEISKAGLFE